MSEELIVLNILKRLKRRLSLILSITFLSVAAVWFLLEFVITPDFQATTQIWVEELDEETTAGNVVENQAAPVTVRAYDAVLKSPEVLKVVIHKLNLSYTVPELHDLITVTHSSNQQVLNITVSNTNSKEAIEIANTLTVVLQETLMEWLDKENVIIITQASEETVTSWLDENMVFGLGLAGVFGLIVGILIAFILEMLNTVFNNDIRGWRRRKKAKEEVKLQTVFK